MNKFKQSIVSFFTIPIKRSELPRFLLITLLMFCILGIQNLIRAQKDSIINTMIGTEGISFLKFWGVLPASMLITILYIKLLNILRSEYIFCFILSSFLLFFLIFAYYIFPNYTNFHLDKDRVDNLIVLYPHFKWFILLMSNWSFSLFYIIAELWPNVVFSMLFWQFVNNITSVEQSKRFYPLFGLIGQTGLIISGFFLESLQKIYKYFNDTYSLGIDPQIFSIQLVMSIVALLGIVALLCFWVLNILLSRSGNKNNFQYKAKTKKPSIFESMKIIFSSKYILLITLLLLCYGIAINLVEGPWKKIASMQYPTQIEFQQFVGGYLKYTGLLTIPFVLICSNIVRKLGWIWAALITPVMMFVTGMLFFISNNFNIMYVMASLNFMITDPVVLVIFIGAIQNALSKSAKYTFFDSTKEMSYVPLDSDLKTKGKAAADVIGTKLGKSVSAFLQSFIFILIPGATYQSISIYLMLIFIVICFLWLFSVIGLNKLYMEKIASQK